VAWRQAQTGVVVFTNGVFDLLHAGHLEYLEAARSQGDALIVAVNSDRSARSLGKPGDRPFVPEEDRARLLSGLAAVDRVLVFDEPTPRDAIAALAPDVLVKGADYTRATVVGADLVEASGGRVELLPLLPARSTTALVEKIRGSR
jgi:D-beta-D-heptose 7-phosphate kinase/D-beta-D-heptose 1-phosphate adenosyltransferase